MSVTVDTKRRVCAHVSMDWKLSRDVLQGVARYAYNATNWDLTVIRAARDYTANMEFDGMIAMIGNESMIERMRVFSPRLISYSNVNAELTTPKVVSDDYAVGARAAEYYLSLGFNHFAFVSNFPDHNYSVRRYAGFRDRLSKVDSELHEIESGKSLLSQVRKLPRPLALLAADDILAVEMVNKLVGAGISVPEEVAVLGVNNDETFCALARVPLSSIGLSSQKAGFLAAKLMDQWIEHDDVPGSVALIEPQDVVERQSTRSYGVSDVVVARAMQYIRDHSTGTIRVEDIASSCGVGRRTLERRFEELLERSPHEAVIESRMDTAKKMLVQTDFSMEEIARRSGFSNKRQLSSTFRRVLNQTPSDYRRAHQLR